ncbi:TAXI family TRAP transporter solute-binding subunit [Pseudorhodoplanes sinuspersici]|uniref:TRAP transporter substrate-binding protein n=1 Tax=Pseudorhodoplanes sinuspersici TaxID=1235591 RepID=A0A1W6ZP30_9HYPH|nr:TAXI family TRAP transporter solute-binding subunit [Pseudorhodoplanes sinuspersici]ARP99156.1 hypothetical protein CAK95_08705 [Pseudorhodoplanes sinuspersici]
MNVHYRHVKFLPPADESPPRLTFRDRMRRMFQHTALIVIGLLLAATGAGAVVAYIQSRPATLKIAVGPGDGEDARMMQGLAQHLAREQASVRLKIVRENGPAESAEALDRNAVDLAVVRRDLAMPKNGQVIAIQRHDIAVLMVPSPQETPSAPTVAAKNARSTKVRPKAKTAAKTDAGDAETATKKPEAITKIEELSGRTIGIIGHAPANVAMLHTILTQSGIPPETVQVIQFSPEDLTTQLRAAKFDALLAVGSVGSKTTAEAVAAISHGKEPPTFLEVGSSEAIKQQKPVYESTEIPAGVFGGSRPAEAVETIGFAHYIVANRTMDEKVAGDFTRWLFAAKQALGSDIPTFTKIEAPDTDKAASLAVHPGALAYLEGEQKTFFDRYSDTLYWGLMLMSFVGSGAAWLTSFARTSASASNRNDLEALIAMIGRARTADDTLELDILRTEIDDIMARAIRQLGAGKLGQNRADALKLAAEQVRHAIAERQAALDALDAISLKAHALAPVV